MIQDTPTVSTYEANSANGQILKSNVYFSSIEKELHTASVSDIPLEFSFAEQCRASQLAEEACLERAIATSSLETAAVEEILYTSLPPSYPQGSSFPGPWLIVMMCLLGMVSISSLSVVSVVALFLGRDISLSALLKPLGFLKFKAKDKNKTKDAKDKDAKDK